MANIQITKVTRWHLPWLMTQRNRPELMKFFRQTEPIQFKSQVTWWSDRMTFHKDTLKLFIVLDLKGNQIGYIGFNPIDNRHKHAEFGIFILPEYSGKGYGTEAMIKLLDMGFNELGFNKIYSDVLDYPGESRFEFYRMLGFKQEGRLVKHYFKNGKWVDAIQFAMLLDEYKNIKDKLGTREKERTSSSKVEVLG